MIKLYYFTVSIKGHGDKTFSFVSEYERDQSLERFRASTYFTDDRKLTITMGSKSVSNDEETKTSRGKDAKAI